MASFSTRDSGLSPLMPRKEAVHLVVMARGGKKSTGLDLAQMLVVGSNLMLWCSAACFVVSFPFLVVCLRLSSPSLSVLRLS